VLLVAVGSYPVPERVPHSRRPFEPAPGRRDPWGMRTLLSEDVSLGQSSYEYVDRAQIVLDIVADVPARYRIQNQRFDYSYLGERRGPSAATNFPLLIKDLLERVPHAVQTRGMRLARGDAGEMLSYPSPTQYEREIAWSLWRFLGPGTRLDGGDPYRSSSAVGPRLTMPLMRSPASRSSASSPARSPGQRTTSALTRPGATLADAGLAVLGGVAVGVAGWLVDPLAALLAWPVARALLQRLHRRRRQHMDTPEAPAGDAPRPEAGATPDRDPEP
ncbi:MAG TPA: hypothetical protein VNM90_06085, partial [Haliangium sp.]|nr:hypothetical protein [Haliangium sp.]